jgi:hypothetical protein
MIGNPERVDQWSAAHLLVHAEGVNTYIFFVKKAWNWPTSRSTRLFLFVPLAHTHLFISCAWWQRLAPPYK